MKLRITILKYHSWYLCQISLQIMLLPALIKSKMATMFSADVTVLQRRHRQKNIPHISCREDQGLLIEGKIISKYCNISKINGRSSINPHAPCTTVGIWLCAYVVQKHYGKSHWASTSFIRKKEIICNTFWELPISLLRSRLQIVIVLSSFFGYFTQSYSQMITCAEFFPPKLW